MPATKLLESSRRRLLLAGAGALLLPARGAASTTFGALDVALDSGSRVQGLNAVAVFRDGQLAAERAYRGAALKTLFRIQSATKSVGSMLVGIALAQGRLRSLSETLGELLPDAAAANPGSPIASITLRQVLTGTTGLLFDWQKDFRALADARDPVQYAFGLARNPQGARSWSYNDAAVGLVSPVLERAYAMPMEDVARRHLFEPLGIDAFEWQRDRAGRALAYGGLRLRVSDFAKLAAAMAMGGAWKGTQVVPADWVAESTRRHVAGAWPNPPITDDSGYGYLWFTGSYKGAPVAWAWGYGSQFALLAPSLRLAVATAASEPAPEQLPVQNRAVAGFVGRIVDAYL